MRIFIIECVNPMDSIQNRSEGAALEKICKIIGHDVAILTAYSNRDLDKYCDYISTIDANHDNENRHVRVPLCVHIAAHGNADGIVFGKDFVDWRRLFLSLNPIIKDMNKYRGQVFISISACGAGRQKLMDEIESEIKNPAPRGERIVCPPEFIFVTEGSQGQEFTYWDDSAVSWTIFYHQLSKLNSINNENIQKILDNIRTTTGTSMRSFEWDKNRERYFRC